MSLFESRERNAGFYKDVAGLTFVLWCCTCTDVWICIALDAALAQMYESILLWMLHLHRCMNLYCSWCCTWRKCLNVYRCLMLHLHWRPYLCTFAMFDWNLAVLCRVKFVRLDNPLLSLSLSLSLCHCVSFLFFYSWIVPSGPKYDGIGVCGLRSELWNVAGYFTLTG
jgi:hypothetical protein